MDKNVEKKKILFTEPVSDMGGVSHYILKIIDFLPKNKYEIHFAADDNGDIFDNLKKMGVITHKVSLNYNSIFSFLNALIIQRQLMKKENFDIIHSHTAKSGFLSSFSSIGLVNKIIYTGHGWRYSQKNNIVSKFIMYCLEYFIIKRSDVTTFLSNKEYLQGLSNKFIKKNKSIVIPISLEVEDTSGLKQKLYIKIREDLSLSKDSILIVMVGRITEQKDPETFIKTLKEIYTKIHNIYFIWVGDGDLHEFIVKKAENFGISDKLYITGLVSNQEVKNILLGCDMMFFTSNYEGLPISILEAMSFKVPVVAPDVGSISDVIVDKNTGRLYPKGDFIKASKIIYDLLNNIEYLNKYSDGAYKLVKMNYSPKEKMSHSFNNLYLNLNNKK